MGIAWLLNFRFVAPVRCSRVIFVRACVRLAALALAIVAGAGTAAAATLVHMADDLCATTADPCVIDRAFDIAAGSRLDFGLRRVRIQEAGLLDFGSGDAQLRCGGLYVTTTGTALRLRGPSASAGSAGANVRWTVLGRCSGNPALACLFDSVCSTAGAGSCGGGDAILGGAVAGDADAPGLFGVTAAGDVTLGGALSLSGTRGSSDGGRVQIESTRGSVLVAAALSVTGGIGGGGGSIELLAAHDVVIVARMDAVGGEFDGGAVAIDAGRDVLLRGDLRVDASAGGGFGGELDAAAGRDLVVDGGSSSNNLVIRADGHSSVDGSGGDGGTVSLQAGGDLSFSRFARIEASGAAPDGFGDEIALRAGGVLLFEGAIVARGRGSFGGAGLVDFASEGAMVLAESAAFDLTGAAAGGDLVLESDGYLDVAATVDASGGSGGVGGRIVAVAAADARIGGRWATGGADSPFSLGELLVEGCRVTVTGKLANAADAGLVRMVARERFTLAGGATMSATGDLGSIRIVHRSFAKPPVLEGFVTPAPTVVVDASLAGCPVCGNGEIDDGEGCDDANSMAGDGCSDRCQDEGCEAGTTDWPGAPLCDDGSECTRDRCDTGLHSCTHTPFDCSDALACTADHCVGNVCVHDPEVSRCDDANPCTDDACSTTTGCMHADRDRECDDGVFCNGSDSCAGGLCVLHAGDPCLGGGPCAENCRENASSCLAQRGSACADDGNVCTSDACDGTGLCAHPAVSAPCADDGNGCTDDRCSASGACVHEPAASHCDDGDPCTADDLCVDGVCPPRPVPLLEVVWLKVRAKKGRGAQPAATVVGLATLPASSLPASPADSTLRVLLHDADSRPLVDAVLAAGQLREDGKVWRYRAPRGPGQGGILRADFDMDAATQVVRAKLRMDGGDIAAMAEAPGFAMALLFGDAEVPALCTSSGSLDCEAARGGLRCRSPAQ